jgi:hypothetical protein
MCKLKFYADTPRGEMNKYFFYNLPDFITAYDKVFKLVMQGYFIRAGWIECDDCKGRLDLSYFTDYVKYIRP